MWPPVRRPGPRRGPAWQQKWPPRDWCSWLQEGFQLIHFIRHPATITALRQLGIPLSEQPNSGLYSYDAGDIIVVVSLRAPQRGQEQQQVNISDLEAWIVSVL